ncbi:MAG: cbb3-type cytochrome c oxidase subunit I, partial [Pseudomonadota bacterium]
MSTATHRGKILTLGEGGLLAFFFLTALTCLVVAGKALDLPMMIHGYLGAAASIASAIAVLNHFFKRDAAPVPEEIDGKPNYNFGVVKFLTVIALFWGVVGFIVGLVIASQLAWPALNLGLEYTAFSRLRPLHTSAVIFAFGGNVLLATSFYVVQRTSRARLAGGTLGPWFVALGYNFFIVVAATGYVLGATQSKEYAEPEWYADLWLTIVWVVYLLTFLGTLWKRKEPHIYVANWFFLAFIVTVALLHIVNNLAVPVSIYSSKSVIVWSGVQDALVQWWYGHN